MRQYTTWRERSKMFSNSNRWVNYAFVAISGFGFIINFKGFKYITKTFNVNDNLLNILGSFHSNCLLRNPRNPLNFPWISVESGGYNHGDPYAPPQAAYGPQYPVDPHAPLDMTAADYHRLLPKIQLDYLRTSNFLPTNIRILSTLVCTMIPFWFKMRFFRKIN